MSEANDGNANGGTDEPRPDRGADETLIAKGSSETDATLDDRTHAERDLERGDDFELPADNRSLGRYVLLDRLGAGGMGVVLEAFDRTLDRRIALKVLHRDLDRSNAQGLLREAQALAKLSHPNVVQVYEAGEADGRSFIAMEFVRGKTLQAWLEQDPKPAWEERVRVYLQAGEGLAAAHGSGLVHRDFKPSNAVIDEQGRVRVLDFGLAREVEERADEDATVTDMDGVPVEGAAQAALTRTGTVMGTPAYMTPEQMHGQDVDARSDQFSFCVALYEALYGERPFEGSSMAALMLAMTHDEVRPAPKASPVPTRVRAALLRGLSVDPEQRWPTMESLLEELRMVVEPPRRRWLGVGLTGGLLAIAVAAGLGLGRYAEVKDRCTGAAKQLEGVWDDAARAKVQQQLLGSEVSYASTTWERVERGLNGYAKAWTDKHAEVCQATRVTQEQTEADMSLRMECLRDRKTHLAAMVRVLGEADEQVVRKAAAAVLRLPSLSRCDDVEALRAAVAPPEDPDLAREVETLREQLAEVEAKHVAGKYADGLAQVEPLEARAKALGYMPLVAEATFWRSQMEGTANGDFEEQVRLANEAYLLALEHGHDVVTLDAVRSLSYVIGFHLHREDEGLQWARVALALAKDSGDERELGRTINAVANVQLAMDHLDEAKAEYERALEVQRRALGEEHPNVAVSLGNLGLVYLYKGDPDRAKIYNEQALAIETKVFGEDHPEVASSLSNLGNVLAAQHEYAKAQELHERALAIQEKALGNEHPMVAGTLNNLGLALQAQGKLEEASTTHQRALNMRQRVLGPEHPLVATSASNLGIVLEMQGKYGLAERLIGHALNLRKETLGPDHPDAARTLENLGVVQELRGKFGTATDVLRQAVEIRERTQGEDHIDVARSHSLLADLLIRRGMLDEAKLHHDRGMAIRNEKLPEGHPDRAISLVGLAEVALAAEQFDVALEHARNAVALHDGAEIHVPADERAAAYFVLARSLWPDVTQRERAQQIAKRARAGFVQHGPESRVALAEVDEWLAGPGAQK